MINNKNNYLKYKKNNLQKKNKILEGGGNIPFIPEQKYFKIHEDIFVISSKQIPYGDYNIYMIICITDPSKKYIYCVYKDKQMFDDIGDTITQKIYGKIEQGYVISALYSFTAFFKDLKKPPGELTRSKQERMGLVGETFVGKMSSLVDIFITELRLDSYKYYFTVDDIFILSPNDITLLKIIKYDNDDTNKINKNLLISIMHFSLFIDTIQEYETPLFLYEYYYILSDFNLFNNFIKYIYDILIKYKLDDYIKNISSKLITLFSTNETDLQKITQEQYHSMMKNITQEQYRIMMEKINKFSLKIFIESIHAITSASSASKILPVSALSLPPVPPQDLTPSQYPVQPQDPSPPSAPSPAPPPVPPVIPKRRNQTHQTHQPSQPVGMEFRKYMKYKKKYLTMKYKLIGGAIPEFSPEKVFYIKEKKAYFKIGDKNDTIYDLLKITDLGFDTNLVYKEYTEPIADKTVEILEKLNISKIMPQIYGITQSETQSKTQSDKINTGYIMEKYKKTLYEYLKDTCCRDECIKNISGTIKQLISTLLKQKRCIDITIHNIVINDPMNIRWIGNIEHYCFDSTIDINILQSFIEFSILIDTLEFNNTIFFNNPVFQYILNDYNIFLEFIKQIQKFAEKLELELQLVSIMFVPLYNILMKLNILMNIHDFFYNRTTNLKWITTNLTEDNYNTYIRSLFEKYIKTRYDFDYLNSISTFKSKYDEFMMIISASW
jgi:hypothetical protein